MSAPTASLDERRRALQLDVYARARADAGQFHAASSDRDVIDFARAVMEKPLIRDDSKNTPTAAQDKVLLAHLHPALTKHPRYRELAWFVEPWREFVRAYTAARAGAKPIRGAAPRRSVIDITDEVRREPWAYFDGMDVPTLEWMRVRYTRPESYSFAYTASWTGNTMRVDVLLTVNGRCMKFGWIELVFRSAASVYLYLFYTHHRTADPERTIWDKLVGYWVDARGVMTAVLAAMLDELILDTSLEPDAYIDLTAQNLDTRSGKQSVLEAYYASLSFKENSAMDESSSSVAGTRMHSTVDRVREAIAKEHTRRGIAVLFRVELPSREAVPRVPIGKASRLEPRMNAHMRVGRIGSRLSVHD
ncbi:MAG: hypothetical protein Q7V62_01820 [Actinomycetota bacterium]|nr:hypothetical protein [Actinomycetota bacterium]